MWRRGCVICVNSHGCDDPAGGRMEQEPAGVGSIRGRLAAVHTSVPTPEEFSHF